ncbi:CHAT domain-containing protein [Suillus spraguei]|nr:CHAT domain-containing protein [Suillus spraguei]
MTDDVEGCREALKRCPLGHSDRLLSLNDLAASLRDRFWERHGVQSDLDESIELHRDALLLRPLGHPDRSISLNNLAASLGDRFRQRGVQSDLDETFRLFPQLSNISHAVSRADLAAAKSWIIFAEETNHSSALVAYQTALKFLDQHVTLLSSSSRHFDAVKMATASLAVDAFLCSIRHGKLKIAVELVEQGRAVFWTRLARFRTTLDELSVARNTGTALAEEFKQLSFGLRKVFDQSAEDHSPQICQLNMQWDDVVSRIRMLPDFSRFLLPPLFSDRQKASQEGPIIITNASQYSCDALIVLSDQDPVHVPIDITRSGVSELSSEFQSVAEQFGCSDRQNKLVGILRKLWHDIVDPVVEALTGPYERGRDNLSQIYISSYTPTLATLIRARKQVSQHSSSQHFVAIGQGNPGKGKELKCVAPELAVVAERLKPVVSSFTSLEDSDATVQACHGMPNRQQSFESSFAMRDGPLMIKDIILSNWHNPEFAFLSACHTTVGDEKSLDESIHLAAAMQFSGFRSVIGSMWSVDDEIARQVVSAFYEKLIDDSGRLDCTRAAVALHRAVKKLRRNNVPLEQQIISFVYVSARYFSPMHCNAEIIDLIRRQKASHNLVAHQGRNCSKVVP